MANIKYRLLSILNKIVPKNSRTIAIYGRSMLNDNTDALLSYLIQNQYYRKYNIVLIVRKDVIHNYRQHVKVINGNFLSIWYVLRSKYIFHAQGMSTCSHAPGQNQIIFNTWHGSPLKKIGKGIGGSTKGDTFYLSASPFFTKINKICFDLRDEQIFEGSNPRNDQLFSSVNIKQIWGWNNYKKIVLFMPTFRNSKGMNRVDADKEFPILTKEKIIEFNQQLNRISVLLIIKPHPYQDNIEFLKGNFSNIKVLYNKDIFAKGLKLYEFLGATDALLTDFSSVYFDYLLLNKPIGFTIDDITSYSKGRGFALDNPLDLMCGMKISNINDLVLFVNNLVLGIDDYVEKRNEIRDLTNSYITPDASKRILDFVGITLD